MLNMVCLQGRLTKDPVINQTQSGNAVVSFTIACDRDYVAKGQERQTDFLECVAWRHSAKFICDYFKKGQMILVTGTLQKRSYDDQSGTTRYITEVIVNSVNFCGKNEQKQEQDNFQPVPIPPPAYSTTPQPVADDTAALPFDIGYDVMG